MNKGDIVRYKATVITYRTSSQTKVMKRIEQHHPTVGIVLGYSSLKTGTIKKGQYYDEPNQLIVEQSHRVIVVEPLEQWNSWTVGGKFRTNRYLEPVRCFENDLELINANIN